MAEREPKLGKVADVANAIQLAAVSEERGLGRTVFLIGAGCSYSAGIPLVPKMAQHLAIQLARAKRASPEISDAAQAYRWLTSGKGFPDCQTGEAPKDGAADARPIDWSRVYDVLFAEYYKTPDHAREIFSHFVDQSAGKINWAHLCLGELVKQRLVSTVLTTNFDQLALAGLVRSGVLPVVCDGIESLTRIRGAPLHPQLVELHGSRHTYLLRNAPEEVEALINDTGTIAAIESLFQELRVFVVVGYGGREKGIMELLIKAASRYTDKQLFWVVHGSDPSRISDNARRLLATSRNAAVVVDQDADSFFVRLLKELGVGAPESMREPLFLADLHASHLASHDSKDISDSAIIVDEIKRHRGEIDALRQGLSNYRKRRTTVERAIVQARELRLAGKLADAFGILQKADKRSKDMSLQRQLAEIAYEYGSTSPDRAPLEAAVAAWRRVAAQPIRARDPLEWARIQHCFGSALWRLGERESGTASLEESVVAHREALKERTRDRVPLEWAATQNNLGNALGRLGERESGIARLDEAVAAYREALKERTRDRVPLEWATTQNNLGTALALLGAHESGTAGLEEAVQAFREALKERTRERVPLEWAMTQSNLGEALRTLGEREKGAARLDEAVAAYRKALRERTRDRVPLEWAATQSNLGAALLALGERESGTVRLDEAVEAYSEALKERTRDRIPLEWAVSHGNQGVALMHLAERRKDLSTAEVALTQIGAAYDTMMEGGHAPFAKYCESQLAKAHALRNRLRAKG
jgi:tetratricopeptide (TPR) repeat protein